MILRIYIAFFIVSCTSLLPYNLFMNAHEYFLFKLRNVSEVDNTTGQPVVVHQTSLQRNFEGYLTVLVGLACILGAVLNLTFTAKLSNTFRVVSGYLLVLASLIPTIIYTYVDTDDDQYSFFLISLSMAAAASAGSNGMMAGGILGLISTYETCYMQAVLLGQSGAGILSTVLSIVCQAITSDDIMNGRIYFFIAVTWTIGSVYFYVMLVRDSQTQERLVTDADDNRQLLDNEDMEGTSHEEEPLAKRYSNAFLQVLRGTDGKRGRFRRGLISWPFRSLSSPLSPPSRPFRVSSDPPGNNTKYGRVGRSSASKRHPSEYFSSIFCFLVFNTGDAIGRIFGTQVTIGQRQFILLLGFRVMLIPLIVVCNVVPRYHTTTFFPWDGVFLLFMILFALSHGLATAQSIQNCAKNAEPELKEIAGSLLNVFCVTSALIGSIFSVFILNIL